MAEYIALAICLILFPPCIVLHIYVGVKVAQCTGHLTVIQQSRVESDPSLDHVANSVSS